MWRRVKCHMYLVDLYLSSQLRVLLRKNDGCKVTVGSMPCRNRIGMASRY